MCFPPLIIPPALAKANLDSTNFESDETFKILINKKEEQIETVDNMDFDNATNGPDCLIKIN
ncbi:hypothetical protein M948_14865 [Virgibacillus sp. CM-4]|nr:hypothetical protein M948_14865 [Virgibacillus sp. CM-4]